ncbi:MAG: MaoC family dehydratase [Pirellulales bacterium]|nr:MaoC family dehydratase [Planctomycetales bacterium]
MAKRVIAGIDEFKTLVGTTLGVSEWYEVTQHRIDAFAEATGDDQAIHCDAPYAQQHSPYGTTIAHGYLTLSLGPALARQVFTIDGLRMAINYGVNRVRFPNAVKVDSRVRLSIELLEVKEFDGGVQATFQQTFEIDGEAKPACVAETVGRLYV